MTLPRPVLRFLDDTHAELVEPYHWTLDYPVTVPAAFVTDGSSVPRWLWALIGHPWALWLLQVAILHDYELAHGVEWFDAWRRMRARLRYTAPVRWKRWAAVAGVWLLGVWRRLTRKLAPA